eukprot:TRINITY_DN40658_c0_g1_i1.p1 TRINITY_DN40658_c0_g1~~TRINITY_DN40658_c0_g1_i1.p1  ORF type:complete len:983 (-),score=261.23 TRINITY_DN40658_c0_g1_i1:79-3027(-)
MAAEYPAGDLQNAFERTWLMRASSRITSVHEASAAAPGVRQATVPRRRWLFPAFTAAFSVGVVLLGLSPVADLFPAQSLTAWVPCLTARLSGPAGPAIGRHSKKPGRSEVARSAGQDSPPVVARDRKEETKQAWRALEGAISKKVIRERTNEQTSREWRKASKDWPEPPPPQWDGEDWIRDLNHGTNVLLQDTGDFPRYTEIKPAHADRGIAYITHLTGEELWDLYTNEVSFPEMDDFAWSDFMVPLEYLTDKLERTFNAIKHVRDVMDSSPAMQKAWDKAQRVRRYAYQRLWRSEKFMVKFKVLLQNDRSTEAQRRAVATQLINFERGGVNIQEYGLPRRDAKEWFGYYTFGVQLSNISRVWDANVERDMLRKAFIVRDTSKWEGVPEWVMKDALDAARVYGYPKAKPENGPWMVTFDDALVEPLLKYCHDREMRETIWGSRQRIAFLGGAGRGDNTPYLTALLKIRLGQANILGYASYAEMTFKNRMATLKMAYAFLARIRKESMPVARQEFRELRKYAEKNGADYELTQYDVPYWRQRLMEEKLSLKDDYLRQFFPFPQVLQGLFDLATRLFGVDIVAADGEEKVWDKHVRFFRMYEKKEVNGTVSSELVGSFFVDPYRRRGKKRPGFWADKIVGFSRLLGRNWSAPRRPAAQVVLDLEAPLQDDFPVLLTLPQVEKVFFSFGSALRHLLCNQSQGLVVGDIGMEADVKQMPAYFMQRWALQAPTLRMISRHWKTGDDLPEAAIQSIVASQTFHGGLRTLERAKRAQVDLDLHAQFDPNGTMHAFEVAQLVEADFSVIPPRIEDHDLCSSKIQTEEGSAVYSDLWADALAADAFFEFETAGLDNVDEVQRLGRKFRKTLLAPGAGRSPGAAMRDFHGRGLTFAPFIKYSGLDVPVEEEPDEFIDVYEEDVQGYVAYESAVQEGEEALGDDYGEVDAAAREAAADASPSRSSAEEESAMDYYADDALEDGVATSGAQRAS